MKKKTTRSQKSPAQAMVEFALVLPVLLLLIYGILEVGRLLFIYSSVVSAARQAARYGSTTGVNASGTFRYRDCDRYAGRSPESGIHRSALKMPTSRSGTMKGKESTR